MKRSFALLCLFLLVGGFRPLTGSAQLVQRLPGELPAAFARRVGPDTALVHPALELCLPGDTLPAILAFYSVLVNGSAQDRENYRVILAEALLPMGANRYERVRIDSIQPDGGPPEIAAAFLVNADRDGAKELALICRFEQWHHDYGGYFYETYFYNYHKRAFEPINGISERFFGCECGYRDRKDTKARYKTAAAVRAGLARMGFHQ